MDYTKLKPSYTVVVQNEDGSSNSRKTSKPVDTFTGPVEKRRRTNVEFLFFFGIFVIIWFLLCLYCVVNGDLNRLHISEDVHIDRESEQDIKNFAKDIKLCSGEIYLSCTCAVGFSALLIILFRRYANVIVWLVIGLVISVFTLITLTCWGVWLSEKARTDNPHSPNAESSASFIFAIISTIVTLIVSLVIYAMRKNIRMVIILFKEGGKVVQSMPLVILQPFVTLAALIVLLFLGVYFFMVIETSGYPQTHPDTNKTVYVKDELMLFAPVYNIVTVLWISQFLIGCQHMVIAGAVATWFFSRDKSGVRNALSRSYTYLYKYHLGSVALGSLIITTVKIIRFIYRIVTRKNNGCVACMLRCVCKYLERFITFLTRNAYIEIAIYGDGFWVSGKRAFEALTNNAVKVATINSVGDFVMYMGRFVVVLCSVIVGNLLIGNNPELHSKGNPLFIIMIFAWIVVDAFMTAFEMIVDTLFICFCEDCDINDGGERPFYMSPELMVFINKDRCKVLRIGDAAVE